MLSKLKYDVEHSSKLDSSTLSLFKGLTEQVRGMEKVAKKQGDDLKQEINRRDLQIQDLKDENKQLRDENASLIKLTDTPRVDLLNMVKGESTLVNINESLIRENTFLKNGLIGLINGSMMMNMNVYGSLGSDLNLDNSNNAPLVSDINKDNVEQSK